MSLKNRPRMLPSIGQMALVSSVAYCLCVISNSATPMLFAAAEDANMDTSTIHDDNSLLEASEILLKVYDETKGLRWAQNTNWLQNTDVCSWYGVTCYGDSEDGSSSAVSDQRRVGHIQKLDLSANRLMGTLPRQVFQLPYLESIDVRDNSDLSVSFDAIGDAQYLNELAISNNNINSLEGLEAASQLQSLHMTSLGLSGSIPPQIFQLSNLVGLFANYNKFSGSLSPKIGQLQYLTELYLFDSDLTGQIPSEIGLLSNLQVLTLAENGFGGTLPTELNKCTKLNTLAINRDAQMQKGGGISGPLPSFAQMESMADLRLQHQLLSGSIPSDFLALAPKQGVVKVELTGNALTGSVPSGLKNLHRLNLFLADNQISSVADDLCNNSNDDIQGWMGGNVGTLGCDAFLCAPGSTSSQGRATPDEPCTSCDGVQYWGSTKCASSSTTTSMGYSEREILISLYNAMGGRYWKHDDGWLSPSDDVCEWYGVDCIEGKVAGLLLKNNDLSNSPPAELFSLPELRHLDFQMNSIDFNFEDVGKATKLESLLLSGCDLSSLDNVGELSATVIQRLTLASNFLTGQFPKEFGELLNLEELDVSHNRLTGELASEIGLLTNLEILRFAKNKLTGQLPSSLGNLARLKNLQGSDNDFVGTLPEELNGLSRLETLSLHQAASSNGIEGPLLDFRNLGQLTILDLSSNKLSGSLPSDFLRNTEKGDAALEVRLGDNNLEDKIPESWANRFQNLILDVTGNRISSIDDSICGMGEWNKGNVRLYSCDGLLCPPGKFNEIGRQTGSEAVCRDCSNEASVRYYGSKICDDSANNAIQAASELGSLKDFFDSTSGNTWKNNAGWMTSNNPCGGWYGVECNADGKVVAIELESNGLSGAPSRALFQLTSLRSLNLKDNQIAFSFEGVEQATNLAVLILSGTGLASTAGISKATSLTELRLTDNKLQGALPEEILLLTSLRKLYLNYNSLSSKIPPNISALKNLEELFLYNNRLQGQLPASLGLLTRLKHLSLAENSFSGTLPPTLNDLTNLEVLSIQREGGTDGSTIGIDQGMNDDVGAGIGGPLLPLDNLKYLRKLYLGVNSLSGSIPPNFLDGIDNKALSLEVDLISNRLTGALPASLTQFMDLSLFVAGNRIVGIADGLCRKDTWMEGAVAQYQCDAILCPPGTSTAYGRQRDESSDCVACPADTSAQYYGSFNCLGAEVVQSLSERTLLEDFFRATGGDTWKHSTSWLDSDESLCTWYGITCAADEESVESIRLSSNGLKGNIPAELYLLPNLKVIDLSQNPIDISFATMEKAEKLEYLQLDSTNVATLSGLDVATGLKVLHIAHNDLNDMQFPTEILALTSLESLDLSSNVIRSLPDLSSQTDLKYFACSECGIAGAIPSWLTTLTNLEHVELDGNSFTGAVPPLSVLSDLKFLNLADQVSNGGLGLTGALPDFSGMSQLQQVYLQRNNLAGSIPLTFMADANVDKTITVDLRSNNITGAIPDISRITDFKLYLASNKIDSISDSVCSKPWNDGIGGASGCDHILCSKGSFNALGRATPNLPCTACDETGFATYFGSTECGPAFEKNLVRGLYESLGGQSWTRQDGWQDHEDFCSWYGITCYEGGYRDGFVQNIDLSENNLKGDLDVPIWELAHMKELDLSKNDITVPFDGIANAQSLETLHVSETKVSNINGIAAAPSLKYLHATNCDVKGAIPDELYSMTQLKGLYLHHNSMTGTLSPDIGQLSQLEELYLFHNSLNGTLPTELGLLAQIEILSLGENSLTGTIPMELGSLQELRVLALQREETKPDPNQQFFMIVQAVGLTGELIPFDNNPKLRELYLNENHLQGVVPYDFLLGVDDTSATIQVDLSSNMLDGPPPVSLVRFDDLRIDVSDNSIRDIPSEICSKTEWYDGALAAGCDAFLCPPGTFNEYGRRIGSEECQTCTFRGAAMFYGSRMCGAMYPQGMSESYMLQAIHEATGGSSWENSDNWLNGDVSVCEWYGVTCEEINGQPFVTELDLSGNGLEGLVPSIVFYLPHLKVLNLARNKVWIQFDDIEYTSLRKLILHETNVASLEGISHAVSLNTLDLRQTPLDGQNIPEEFYTLGNLTIADLSGSGLVGTLSSSLGQMRSLVSLTLDRNDLSGEIPGAIGMLAELRTLALSDNNLWGSLPSEMSSLTSLESLYLDAYNRKSAGVSGPLLEFSSMPKLRELYLGSNSFTGSIPTNLLAGVDSFGDVIVVDVGSNHLTGTVPSQLSSFDNLNLDVSHNYITALGAGLCDKSSWSDGAVGSYSCDGLACPAGTYNDDGRQSSADTPCIQCQGAIVPPYIGQISCLTDAKKKEKEILELFYKALAGDNWKTKTGWLGDDDYCSWFGVTCTDDSTVQSISLGSNNLAGTPPHDIFDLKDLQSLWLYSNPISFKFDSISKASNLQNLRLDSTGLASLEGLDQARSLVEVDVRFNRLKGQLPNLDNLEALETFSCSSNRLSGSLPSFSANTKLVSLRVGGNNFSGFLPPFSDHPAIQTGDFAANDFSGPIPDSLFARADSSAKIFLDLSSNSFTGSLPASLSRFSDLTLYVRDNQISGLPPSLCSMQSWNQGDVAFGGCDGILCPPSTYSPSTGRSSRAGSKCEKCDAAQYFGSTSCGKASSAAVADTRAYCTSIIATVLSTVFILLL